jgi:hypothetical protein
MPGSAVSARATDETLPIGSNSGSVGAYAKSENGSVWLLTANHVISQNGEFRNMERVPGGDDGVYVNQVDRVSFEVKFVKIVDTGNVADIAGAKLETPSVIPRRNLYDGLVLDGRPYLPPKDAPVKIFARARTKGGIVTSTGANGVRVAQSFEPRFPIYDNQIYIQGQSEESVEDGDSGSLVAAFDSQEETWRPIGFVFAKTNNTGLAVVTPLQATFDSLERWTGKMTKILVSGEL